MGQDLAEAKRILGEPVRVIVYPQFQGIESNWDYFEYEYDGITIGHPRIVEKVYLIVVHGQGYKTCRGVKIGDAIETMLRKYGKRFLSKYYTEPNEFVYYFVIKGAN